MAALVVSQVDCKNLAIIIIIIIIIDDNIL